MPSGEPFLTAEMLLVAYRKGMFPMMHDDGELYWHDPDPRAIIPLEVLRPNKRTARFFRNEGYGTTFNTDFEGVMRACAERQERWIDGNMIRAFTELHERGAAMSVETWQMGKMIGGIYGVAMGNVFFGESMFSRRSNASKAALFTLAEHLRNSGYTLFDTQYLNEHTRSLGAVEIPRSRFRELLAIALEHVASTRTSSQ